jgi:hypothetical protein
MGISAQSRSGKMALIANLTGNLQKISLDHDFGKARISRLNADNFVAASKDTRFLENSQSISSNTYEIDAYEVIKIISS